MIFDHAWALGFDAEVIVSRADITSLGCTLRELLPNTAVARCQPTRQTAETIIEVLRHCIQELDLIVLH